MKNQIFIFLHFCNFFLANFLSNKICQFLFIFTHFFIMKDQKLCEIEFYEKNAFFWGIACWNSSKLQNLKVLLIFSNFCQFFVWFLEKFFEQGPNEFETMSAFRKPWFLSQNLLWSRDRWGGASRAPPFPGRASQISVWLGLKPWLFDSMIDKVQMSYNKLSSLTIFEGYFFPVSKPKSSFDLIFNALG